MYNDRRGPPRWNHQFFRYHSSNWIGILHNNQLLASLQGHFTNPYTCTSLKYHHTFVASTLILPNMLVFFLHIFHKKHCRSQKGTANRNCTLWGGIGKRRSKRSSVPCSHKRPPAEKTSGRWRCYQVEFTRKQATFRDHPWDWYIYLHEWFWKMRASPFLKRTSF